MAIQRDRREIEHITSLLNQFKEAIRQDYKAEIVGVFGSYVRGEQKPDSDLDVLVRFLQGATLFDLVGLADFLEENLCLRVDVVPVDTVREEIKDSILREMVYL